MKSLLVVSCLTLVLWLPCSKVHSQEPLIPIDVHLFGGQSNSCGPVGPAPNHLLPPQQHYFRTNCSGAFDDWTSTYVGQLKPTYMWGTAFGPEVSFGQAFTEKIAIIKFAKSGSSMARWIDGDRELFEGMKVEVAAGLADLVAQGFDPTIRSYEFNHGEFDSGAQATADVYAAKMQTFIEALRTEYGQQVRFIYNQLHYSLPQNWPSMQWVDEIRAAQEYIANTVPNVRMVNIDDLVLSSDNLHYSPAMTDIAGRRNAMAYLTPGDLNYDGTVDGVDFLYWQRTSGRQSELQEWMASFESVPSLAMSVPEPSTLVMTIGFLLIAGRKMVA